MNETVPILPDEPGPNSPDRRRFLNGLGLSAGALLLTPALGLTSLPADANEDYLSPYRKRRRKAALKVRKECARQQYQTRNPGHPSNDDENLYPDYRASYAKGLPHDPQGMVDPAAYRQYLDAIQSGTQAAFEALPLTGPLRLANPLAAYAFDLIGADPHMARIEAAPAFASRNLALDMLERYWMALCRDLPFHEFTGSTLIAAAIADLNRLGWYEEFGFELKPQTLFRAQYKGAITGPLVSQFLYLPSPFGPSLISQRNRTVLAERDYLTDPESWAGVNDGAIDPTGKDAHDPDPYYIRNLRDGAAWVHSDLPHQAPSYAAQLLWSWGRDYWSDANPYKRMIRKSTPFTTWGLPDILGLIGLAANYALRFAWFQKWCVHRRLRPEVFAQRVHRGRTEAVDLGIHPVLFDSDVLERIFEHNRQQNLKLGRGIHGSYLLPQAYPEGSPAHPAYPAGHSAVIAAGVTICKAFFDEEAFIPKPKVPNEEGTELMAHDQPLSVGGELNKLVGNISLFRDAAGVHWRTDGAFNPLAGYDTRWGGNVLGEEVALAVLRDVRTTYPESFPAPFRITRLDGSVVEIE